MNNSWTGGSAVPPPAFENNMASQSTLPYNQEQQYNQVTPQSSTYYNRNKNSNKQMFACLYRYTKQLTQKRKVWHDGKLTLTKSPSSFHMVLLKATPSLGTTGTALEECDLTIQQGQMMIASGSDETVETEKHLIQVQGPWIEPSNRISTTPNNSGGPSTGMQKILRTKFRKPNRFIPPPPQQQKAPSLLGKRTRPLQPGELQRRHYGESCPPVQQQQQQQQQLYGGSQQPSNWGGQQEQRHSSHPSSGGGPHEYRPSSNNNHCATPSYPEPSRNTLGHPEPSENHARGPVAGFNYAHSNMNTGFASGNPYAQGSRENRTPQQQHQPSRVDNNDCQQFSSNQPPPPIMDATRAPPTSHFVRNGDGHDGNKENHRQPQDMQSTDRTRPSQNSFANNDFDPNSIYGEEEDDDDMNHHNDAQSTAPWHGNYNTASTNSSITNAWGPALDTNRQQEPRPSGTLSSHKNVPSGEQDNTGVAEKKPLSTNQLLQLFGVGSAAPTDASDTERVSEEVRGNPATAPLDGNDNDGTPNNDTENQYAFDLPSQSSSDSSSLDDD